MECTQGVHNRRSAIFSLQNDCQDISLISNATLKGAHPNHRQKKIEQIMGNEFRLFVYQRKIAGQKQNEEVIRESLDVIKLRRVLLQEGSLKTMFCSVSCGLSSRTLFFVKTSKRFRLSQQTRIIYFGRFVNSALNFINKMKVYSASKLRRNPCQLNEAIKTNITQLASLLKCTSSQSLSLTPSMQSLNAQEEAINLAKEFVSNLSDPFQCMILYPLVLDCSFTCSPDPLFQYTSFPQQLHSLLSLYLYKCTSYTSLDRRSRKVIDLFYRYVSEEGGQAYETWLGQNNNRSLGEWFYTECISSFFQLLYKDQESYTIFLTNYLKYGLAYLFLSAAATIKGIQNPPECESSELQRIRVRFIGKHNID